MLERWFKKDKLKSTDPAVRLRGVAQLDPASDAEKLTTIARLDPADQVRLAALDLIQSKSDLHSLLADSVTADLAASKLAAHLKLPEDAPYLQTPEVLKAYLKIADANDTQTAAQYLEDPEQVVQLVIQARGQAKDHLFKHPILQSESGLQTLERLSRGRDKKSNRHARVLIDAIKKARQHHDDATGRLTQIDERLDRAINDIAQQTASSSDKARIDHLQNKRTACLAELLKQRDLLATLLQSHDFKPIPEAPVVPEFTVSSQNGDPALIALEQSLDSMPASQLLERWADIDSENREADNPTNRQQYLRLAEIMAQVAAAHEKIQTWLEQSQPASSNPDQPHERQTWQAWLRTCQDAKRGIHWPSSVQSPETLAQIDQEIIRAQAHLEAINSRQQSLHQAAKKSIEDALSATHEALEAGHYQQSVAAIKRARAAVAEHASQADANYERELSTLSARLAELKDWQKYATLPKRGELLTELRSIATDPVDPASQADRLRKLRQQWQDLGAPASTDERSLQNQFDDLAEQAFAPCKAYYAEQEAHRAENLSAREALCEQLALYLDNADWHNTDYRAAEKIMRTAREEWRRFHPCDRKALKPVEQRFESLQKSLYDNIKGEWDRNVAKKQAIVAQAKALLTLQDGADMADQAKQLQQEWRAIGPTPRTLDQRLWQSFRGACDDIFKQRKDTHLAAVAETDRKVQEIEAAIDTFAAAAKEDLSQRRYDELNLHIEALMDGTRVPKQTFERLSTTRRNYGDALRVQGAQQADAELKQLLTWDRQLSLRQIDSDDPVHAYFKDRTGELADRDTLLKLVLEAEIVADISSPSADQSERMALQIRLMNQGQRNTGQHDPNDLLKQWCALPKQEVEDLQDRFAAAIVKMAGSTR